MSRNFLFVGGGSGGHVAPGIAVAEALVRLAPDAQPRFLCADRPDEIELLAAHGWPAETLQAPRFPRHCLLCALAFPFAFFAAVIRSMLLLRRLRPVAVFAKGGPVSACAAVAAWLLRIPVILHCSDAVPSIGDRVLHRFVARTCIGFPDLPLSGARYTGNPVRHCIVAGSRDAGRRMTGFSGKRPVVLIMGGSQGARNINQAMESILDQLLTLADIIHLTGRGKGSGRTHARLFTRESVTVDLPHLLALAHVVVTRAGAGALSEIAALGLPAIVVPLAGVAHDHQRKNALWFAERGAVRILEDDRLRSELLPLVRSLLEDRAACDELRRSLRAVHIPDAAERIAQEILDVANFSR